jgi:DNA-binding IclR family transcriptional regulator
MPLSRGAIGRSIIAFLPRRHLLPLVKRTLPEWQAAGVGETVEDVLDSFKAVRKVGYALAHGEVTPGVIGLAAPIFDVGQSPIASISVTVAEQDVKGADVEEIGQEVRISAAEISTALASHRHRSFRQ